MIMSLFQTGHLFRKFSQISVEKTYGLHKDDAISEYLIPTTFCEEKEYLHGRNMDSLKRHM
jgi:hypothetical protein